MGTFPIIIWIAVFLGIGAEFWRTFENQVKDYAVNNETLTFGKFFAGSVRPVIFALLVYVGGLTGAGFADVLPGSSLVSAIPSFITGQGIYALAKTIMGSGAAKKLIRKVMDVKSNIADNHANENKSAAKQIDDVLRQK